MPLRTEAPDRFRGAILKVGIRLRLLRADSLQDLRRGIENAGVQTSLFVCTTPRSGSNLLDGLLESTGLIGEPSEDLGPGYETWRQATHGRMGFSTYLLSCVGRVRGGVASMKVHGYQRERLLQELGLLRGAHRYRDAELIAAAFPMPRYVWLRRRDVVAQAISWLRAKRSGVWIGPQGPLGPLPDIERLDDLVREAVGRMNAENERWRQWFSTNDVEPLQLFYEQLDVDPTAAVTDVLSLVGADVPEKLVVTPRTVRQADSASEQWISDFRERQSDEKGRQ